MAYGKSYVKVKRGGRSNKNPSGYKKAMGYAGMAYKAWSMAKYIKSLINVEKKFFDYTNSGTVPNTITCASITSTTQGDTYANRDGNLIKAKSLLVKCLLDMSSSATDTNVRLIVFKDNEQAGTTPTAAELLEVTTSPTNLISPLNHINGKRFNILIDKEFAMSINGKRQYMFERYIDLSHHIKYADNGLKEGNIFWCIVSNEATNVPSHNFYSRLRFVDN